MTDRPRPMRRALISVSDKTGLVELGTALAARGVELISTGGTAKALRDADLTVQDVSDVTEFPEMMDGRVKTLHPRVHGGLLAKRDDAEHQSAANAHGIVMIDLLVVNLYPFEDVRAQGADYDTSVENIDIGGPAMIRAAAKNHEDVAVIVGPDQYAVLLDELENNAGATTFSFRRKLAAAAYTRTAAYDAAISNWMNTVCDVETPAHAVIAGTFSARLRYGENPHQSASLYLTDEKRPGAATARQIHGKALSYNNLNDTDAAFELVSEFSADGPPAIAIIKHANPCGVATGATLAEAYAAALRCDPVSAFGGIVAANQPLDADTAEAIAKVFTEVVIAPGASDAAIAALSRKKDLRLLLTDAMADPRARRLMPRPIAGGLLIQDRDNGTVDRLELKVVTQRQPTTQELSDLMFAFRVAKHVKSNAIVYARDGATVGVGAGQMSRVDSARIAAWKAMEAAKACGAEQPLTQGAVVASDAFFPFADGLLEAAGAGITAVIQPGGSIRDEDVIAAADEKGLAMVFTGMRHFRH